MMARHATPPGRVKTVGQNVVCHGAHSLNTWSIKLLAIFPPPILRMNGFVLPTSCCKVLPDTSLVFSRMDVVPSSSCLHPSCPLVLIDPCAKYAGTGVLDDTLLAIGGHEDNVFSVTDFDQLNRKFLSM